MDEKTNWFYWAAAFAGAAGIIFAGVKIPFLLTTFHVLVCVSLILVVLLQSGRAADLAGAFGGAGSQTAFGPRGAATFLSKATTFLAVVFMVTSLVLAIYASQGAGSSELPQTLPGTEQAAPATTQPTEQEPGAGSEQAPPEGQGEAQQPPPSGDGQ